MMMTIALRFIPLLIEETDKIMNAQKARGAQLDSGTLMPVSYTHLFTAANGVGPKLGQRIVMELKDKVGKNL